MPFRRHIRIEVENPTDSKFGGYTEIQKKSDLICEGNQEIYLDGSKEPQMEYLGTEDGYGYSWGMAGGIQSDHYAAITRIDDYKAGGLFTMLRCRGIDTISFDKSCRWVVTKIPKEERTPSANQLVLRTSQKRRRRPYCWPTR